ncbi:MAG: hypothetical protein M3071_22685 [Actinomycetota bacterium]|nr:hypothetical protein [Actinomycetota bacterium]
MAALAAFAAGSAQAAITAVTGPVTSVTADTATVTGTVTTGGDNVQWEFAYNLASNLFVGGFSTGGLIGAGATTPVPVTDTITNLTPSTAYTYEMVATDVAFGSTYYLNVPVYGAPPLTFTTKGPGKASLASTKLKVKRGRVIVGINCSMAFKCDGGVLAITARHKGKKVTCGSAAFNVAAGATKKITTSKASAKCAALLVLAPKHKVKAHLTAGFTYQKGISKGVTLIAVK